MKTNTSIYVESISFPCRIINRVLIRATVLVDLYFNINMSLVRGTDRPSPFGALHYKSLKGHLSLCRLQMPLGIRVTLVRPEYQCSMLVPYFLIFRYPTFTSEEILQGLRGEVVRGIGKERFKSFVQRPVAQQLCQEQVQDMINLVEMKCLQ